MSALIIQMKRNTVEGILNKGILINLVAEVDDDPKPYADSMQQTDKQKMRQKIALKSEIN